MMDWFYALSEGNQIMTGIFCVLLMGVVGWWLIERAMDMIERREAAKHRRGW